MPNIKIKTVDIETANFDADWGYVFCISVKELGKKVRTYSLLTHPGKPWHNDKNLLEAARKDLIDTNAFITWYGARFDIPLLNARFIKHGIHPLPMSIPNLDLWKTCRNHLKISSNGLANFLEFTGLGSKMFVKKDTWVAARGGDKDAINIVIKRCESDVRETEKAYKKLLPLIGNHPNVNLIHGIGAADMTHCEKCGHGDLRKEGWKYTKMYQRQMYSCKNCGHWPIGPLVRRTDLKVA